MGVDPAELVRRRKSQRTAFRPPLRSETLVQFPCRFHHDAPGLPAIQRAGALDAVLTKQMHETITAATAAENAHLFPVEKRIEVAVLPERLRINQLFESVPADDFCCPVPFCGPSLADTSIVPQLGYIIKSGNRGAHGDSPLILAPLGVLNGKPPPQTSVRTLGGGEHVTCLSDRHCWRRYR